MDWVEGNHNIANLDGISNIWMIGYIYIYMSLQLIYIHIHIHIYIYITYTYIYIQCEAPKIAKLVYNSNNYGYYGLWYL